MMKHTYATCRVVKQDVSGKPPFPKVREVDRLTEQADATVLEASDVQHPVAVRLERLDNRHEIQMRLVGAR